MVKIIWLLLTSLITCQAFSLPKGFVYLHDVDPSIIQEIRYAADHNFVGRPIHGYQQPVCILTLPTALALKKIQATLLPQHHSLKVYDCYRPMMAVQDFVAWVGDATDERMKTEFYPRTAKTQLFPLGYIADHSSHCRGSTVDVTLVDLRHLQQEQFTPSQKLLACYQPRSQRFKDNSIDMGTGYDCMDEAAHLSYSKLSTEQSANRKRLRTLMENAGFVPYEQEWWHFTLKNEPYPITYQNFVVK